MIYRLVHVADSFVVINKAAGVDFHREGRAEGLFDRLRADLHTEKLYPLHRLDKVTSGLLLIARTREAAQVLAQMIQEKNIEKYYLALAGSRPKKKQGTIIGDMEKSRRGSYKLLHSRQNPAITQFFSCSASPGLRLYLMKAVTGRTHQLRVAMKSIGAPILGDPLYSSANPDEEPIDRCYLHSYCLRFDFDSRPQTFILPPDAGQLFRTDFCKKALAAYTEPWLLNWPGSRQGTGGVTGAADGGHQAGGAPGKAHGQESFNR